MVESMFQSSNPWRPVDARFRRAEEILRHGKRVTRYDDPWIATLLSFLRKLTRCYSESDLAALRQQQPAVYRAFQIHQEMSPALKSTLEARFLAAETDDGIANKTGLESAAVEAYRFAFFDIVERRGCVDFVVDKVIGRPSETSSDLEIDGCLKKSVGYFFGVGCLDEILYPSGTASGAMLTSSEAFESLTHGIQRFKAAQVLQRLKTTNPSDRRELLKAMASNASADENSDESHSMIEKHIHAMLSEIPWVTGKAAAGVVPKAILEVDEYAAELDEEELMLLAAGELDPARLDEVKGLGFPTVDAQGTKSASTGGGSSPQKPGGKLGMDGSTEEVSG